MTQECDDDEPGPAAALRPLLRAEAAAEAYAAGVEAADVEQGVLLRLLERDRAAAPADAGWVRAAVRAEVRAARRRAGREVPYGAAGPGAYGAEGAGGYGPDPAGAVVAAEHRRALRAAVRRLPGRCPGLLAALLDGGDPTYRDISGELAISQGSLGPVRSHCLTALRRMLTAEVAPGEVRGNTR
ncbi:sigma-70 family RNA polymerase sigma factor [Streptomyces sp. MAR4 CNX-425]|uniref:sigma-70 family RNA polymerase sigma factor n=1 Tax=Streptomyces sp. MAR4 CNX-425 TaxID=3406343 RepID=UPI003B50FB3F